MTQIYTSNTVLVKAKAPIVNFYEGDIATLVADVDIFWINTGIAQRFLTHKWQESNDNGVTWRDIPSGTVDHPLARNNALPTKTISLLDNQLEDLELSEFNIAKTKKIKSSLTIDNVLLSQDNYLYRCIVLLYNNDLNTIESVGTSENIFLNISEKKTGHVLPNFDIPWDPMNPRGVIKSGNLNFDQNTTIEIFKLTKNTCGSQWRVIEVGYNVQYLSGNITNGVPVGLPKSYGPNSQSYPGYMELQFYCDGSWVTQESWISLDGEEEHEFQNYDPISPVSVSLNGQTVVSKTLLNTQDAPLVIKPSTNSVGGGGSSLDITGQFFSYSINVIWNPTAIDGSVLGIRYDSIQTITVPAEFSLPVQVTITGLADDDLVINETIIDSSNNQAGPVDHTFTCTTRTFTVGVYNASCCSVGYDYIITFTGNRNDSALSNLRSDSTNIFTISQIAETKTVTVNGNNNSWVDAGINVQEGSRLFISTTGNIQWSTGNFSSPSGVSSGNMILYSGIPQSALVGKIGSTGTPFYVGDYYNSFANTSGLLFLSINDDAKNDNSGSYVSVVKYATPDPIGIKVTTLNSDPYNPEVQDLDFAKVSLLLKADEDSVNDMSAKPRSFNSTSVRFGTQISNFGGYSSYYGNNGYSIANSDSSLGFPGDFTIEGWFYFDKNNIGHQALLSTYRDRDVSGWLLLLESNKLYFYAANANSYWSWPLAISSNYTPELNQWIYIVVQRLGNSVKMFANGVEIGSTNNSTDITSGSKIELGSYPYMSGNSRRSLSGYIDEVRITKGLARYPQNNPPIPNKPFPKTGYSSVKNIDISGSQKSAVPVYDSNNNFLYYKFNSKNSFIGPYNEPGQISLVYSYTAGSPIEKQSVGEGYFQAFDGSNRYFRKLGFYDLDCCYQYPSYSPDDGYYILTKRADGQCVVFDSVRWYAANGYEKGKIVPCIAIPESIGHPNDSATWRSMGYSGGCCNGDGTKNYYELSDEVFFAPTPTPTVTPTSATPTPTPTVTSTITATPTITPSVTTSAVPPSFDSLYSDVILLMNMSGTNNSKTIIDSSLLNNTIVATGNAAISTAQSRFGGSSLLVPEATSSRNGIYLSASNEFNFGSGNFTVEFWLRQNSTPQSGSRVFQTSENNDTSSGVDIYYPTNSNSLLAKLSDNSNNTVVLSLGATDTSVWNHYALVRQNNTFITYRNGVRLASENRSLNLAPSSGNVVIGGNATIGANRSINAYIDDFRVSRSARYIDNFIPSVFQLSNQGPPITPSTTATPTVTPSSGFIP